jgi:pimeloyl-ACP methyl ester carboxylesterase
MDSLAWFAERLVQACGVARFDVVVHDWGSIALVLAARWPDSIGRVVVINAVPLTSEYQWHWVARVWRRRGLGELMLATTTRAGSLQALRWATPRRGSLPEVADEIHRYLDRETKRAILELYRDADPARLEAAGRDLGKLRCLALVLWGDGDRFIAPRFAEWFASALGGETRVEHLPDAGHWPWIERPDTVELATSFLTGSV